MGQNRQGRGREGNQSKEYGTTLVQPPTPAQPKHIPKWRQKPASSRWQWKQVSRSVLPLQAGRGGERRVGRRKDSQPGERQPTLSTNRTEVYTQMCIFSYLCLLATQHSDKLSGSIRHLGRWIENCGGFCHLSSRKHSC